MRRLGWVVMLLGLTACREVQDLRPDLVFLTRDGCVQTDQTQAQLDAALAQMGHERTAYRVVDLASLAADDARRGYPTPTILYRDRDLFGMPTPVPPFPDPT